MPWLRCVRAELLSPLFGDAVHRLSGNGRREYGGMEVSQAHRLKELEKENARLRKAISDLTLDKLILNEALTGSTRPFTPSSMR